jgi:hypothetical protein
MPIPLVAPLAEPIPSYVPTAAQRNLIAGTAIQVGGVQVQGFFTSLQADANLRIIGQVNPVYNCISWSHGVTNAWNNPPANPNTYYGHMGYTPCTQGDANKKIAVWMDANGNTTHAARRMRVTINGAPVYCWTSKLGQSYCIAHSTDHLNGGVYGNPAMFFR